MRTWALLLILCAQQALHATADTTDQSSSASTIGVAVDTSQAASAVGAVFDTSEAGSGPNLRSIDEPITTQQEVSADGSNVVDTNSKQSDQVNEGDSKGDVPKDTSQVADASTADEPVQPADDAASRGDNIAPDEGAPSPVEDQSQSRQASDGEVEGDGIILPVVIQNPSIDEIPPETNDGDVGDNIIPLVTEGPSADEVPPETNDENEGGDVDLPSDTEEPSTDQAPQETNEGDIPLPDVNVTDGDEGGDVDLPSDTEDPSTDHAPQETNEGDIPLPDVNVSDADDGSSEASSGEEREEGDDETDNSVAGEEQGQSIDGTSTDSQGDEWQVIDNEGDIPSTEDDDADEEWDDNSPLQDKDGNWFN